MNVLVWVNLGAVVVLFLCIVRLAYQLRQANALNRDLTIHSLDAYHAGGVAFGNALAQHAKAEGREDVVIWMQDFIATQQQAMTRD